MVNMHTADYSGNRSLLLYKVEHYMYHRLVVSSNVVT